jgi:hypothetical protein
MSLNVTRTALDVIGVGRIYYNQQEKDEGSWSKTIGPFLIQENKRKNLSVTPAQAAENSGGILAIDRFSLDGKGYAGISGTRIFCSSPRHSRRQHILCLKNAGFAVGVLLSLASQTVLLILV